MSLYTDCGRDKEKARRNPASGVTDCESVRYRVHFFFSLFSNTLALEIAQLTPDVVQTLIMLFADGVLLASYCVAGLQRQGDVSKHFADSFSIQYE